MSQITITKPDDWHLHFRDGELLKETVPATARCFQRAIVMPNLVPPVRNKREALAYKERILAARPTGSDFDPLMVLYLTNDTSVEDIHNACSTDIPAAKLYPAGATTNSDAAVKGIESLYPVFEAMSDAGMLLLIHGEVTSPEIDIFDREKVFIDQHLVPIHERFPKLKIVFEHITTADAADFVISASDLVAATIIRISNVFEKLQAVVRVNFFWVPTQRHTPNMLKEAWTMPTEIALENGDAIVPFFAGQTLNWRIV